MLVLHIKERFISSWRFELKFLETISTGDILACQAHDQDLQIVFS